MTFLKVLLGLTTVVYGVVVLADALSGKTISTGGLKVVGAVLAASGIAHVSLALGRK